MSFYGDIKRVNSSPYVFDKYYPNRAAMEAAATSDGIYVGRFVLVKYTCKYNKDNQIEYFDKYQNNTGSTKVLNVDYEANQTLDLNRYHDTFDGTVWQKIYTNVTNENQPSEKYILIAELNADAPRLGLNIVNPKYTSSEGVEYWREPSVNEELSSEDVFTFNIPDTLHLDVGELDEDFYGKGLIASPAKRDTYDNLDISNPPENYQVNNKAITPQEWASYTDEQKRHIMALSSDYNYMAWINMLGKNAAKIPGDIDGKKLDTKLYAFGQLISDLYDVLYGVPNSEDGKGYRPYYTDESLANLVGLYDKGLVGILTSIATEAKGDAAQDLYGRALQPGLHYYFVSKWGSASEDPSNFIENIPNVIGASPAEGGSAAASQYYIKFDANDGKYLTKIT